MICFPCYTERMVALIPEDQPEANLGSISLDSLRDHQILFLSNNEAWERYIIKMRSRGAVVEEMNLKTSTKV